MAAMKAGNTVEQEELRGAGGEIQTEEARAQKPLGDDEAAAIVRKLIKSNQETLGRSERDEQKQELLLEIAVLESLLPKTLGVDEIITALAPVADAIKAAGND